MASLSDPAISVVPSMSKEFMGSGEGGMIAVVSMAPRAMSLLSHTVTLPPEKETTYYTGNCHCPRCSGVMINLYIN